MDDVARAEEALVEAMARTNYETTWGEEGLYIPWDKLHEKAKEVWLDGQRDALAAAREVTVSVLCPRCDGRAEVTDIVRGDRMEDWLVPCPAGCSNGTVSRSALAVLNDHKEES